MLTREVQVLSGPGNDVGTLRVQSNGEVELLCFGELPIEAKIKGGFRSDKLRARLRFEGGRWKVVEQKLENWSVDPELPGPRTLATLTADRRFSLDHAFVAPDGTGWAIGTAEDGHALLLRDRSVKEVWRTSDAALAEVPEEQDPNCAPRSLSPRGDKPLDLE
jgi:hypothetical protein